ncbi:chloride channel protein ClC-Kb [Corchorus olitorius]|uniref:Chloride channel protein ClC-Kb n=1 Tax=Corchorus olitorius TaxID=93759 RepID=A0A1R3K4L4_9ROSI|nr:chloride channel protein ClC-Kb [Corchorus olitorius]
MAKDDQEKALIANGVEAGTIWSERPQEQNFWISIAYPDTRFFSVFAHLVFFVGRGFISLIKMIFKVVPANS